MKCKVDFYRTPRGDAPVQDFLNELPAKLRAKNVRELGLLAEYGVDLPAPYAKQLHGKDARGLWELRVKLASDITRVFYFFPVGNRVLLLHGFSKKSEETPELQTAIHRMKDAIERGL